MTVHGTGRVRKRDRAARGILAAVLVTGGIRPSPARAGESQLAFLPAPDHADPQKARDSGNELVAEFRVGASATRPSAISFGPAISPMVRLDDRNSVGILVAAEVWTAGALSFSPGIRYRRHLSPELACDVSIGPSFFAVVEGASGTSGRLETSLSFQDALVLGMRVDSWPETRETFVSPFLGVSGEGAAIAVALGLGLLFLAAAGG